MKLLFISAAYPPLRAGEADHAYHQCVHLANRGIEVHVLTTQSHGWKQDVPFTVHPIMRDWSWSDLPRFVGFLKRCKPDHVFLYYIGWVYNDHPMITFAPTICRSILSPHRMVTMIAYPMGSQNERLSYVSRAIRKCLQWWVGARGVDYRYGTILRDSDAVILMSERHHGMLMGEDPILGEKAVLVPPPPLLTMTKDVGPEIRQETRTRLGFTQDDLVVVYFGLIYPPKGIETLLKAFHLAVQELPSLRLLLVGGVVAHQYPDRPRFAEEMRELPDALGFAERVVWTGEYQAESDEASRYLYASDMCVFSHDLGLFLNNSSFAAVAAHGLPVVATRGEMVEKPFVEEENVIFCRPKSVDSMAAAIIRVANDAGLRTRLAEGALTLASKWFSWKTATDRIVDLYEPRV